MKAVRQVGVEPHCADGPATEVRCVQHDQAAVTHCSKGQNSYVVSTVFSEVRERERGEQAHICLGFLGDGKSRPQPTCGSSPRSTPSQPGSRRILVCHFPPVGQRQALSGSGITWANFRIPQSIMQAALLKGREGMAQPAVGGRCVAACPYLL